MSDFGSGLEQCGPMHELSGRASKADLRRRIAELEAELSDFEGGSRSDRDEIEGLKAERDKMLEGLRLSIVRRKQEAALYGDNAEWEGLAVALGLVDDALGRARAKTVAHF